jgi:hypothetical protein
VAGWQRTSREENESDDDVEHERRRDLVLAIPRKGFHFIPQRDKTVIPTD